MALRLKALFRHIIFLPQAALALWRGASEEVGKGSVRLCPALVVLLLVGFLAACSSIDCPLNNVVYTNYKLDGPVQTLPDTLTITTTREDGLDSVLINQQVNTDSFSLPISYGKPEDILFFHTGHLHDTVWVQKTNEPHFESVDCGLNYFHTIMGVRFTRHALDSVVIHNNRVSYDVTQKHFYIYFKEYRL